MKKLVTALALCASFSAFAQVESANIVGYTTVPTLAGTYTMIGGQFEGVGGGGMPVQSIKGSFVGGTGLVDSDNLLVWSNGSYKSYFFGNWAGAYGAEYDNLWYWGGDDANPSTDVIMPGQGLWFLSRSGSAGTATFSGQVKVNNTNLSVLANTYTLFSNPYPTEVAINSASFAVTGATGGTGLVDSDNLLVWANGSYKSYFFGNWAGAYGAEYDNLWYWGGDDANPTTDTFKVGQAAWYLRRGAATTMSFVSPL